MEIVRLEASLEETVRGDVLQLLQRVDLREFVLDSEFVFRIDVCDEFAHWCFGLEEDGLLKTRDLKLLELGQTAARVRA